MWYPSLSRTILLGFSAIILAVALEGYANGQTATYHLHKELSSTSGLDQLKTAGPDAATVALTSVNLKGLATGEYIIKAFDTQSGVPNVSGVIPSGSTVTFTLWLKKTANAGTMFPRAKLNLNSATGTSLCSTTGSTAVTTTLAQYTLTCTTGANISMTATDRFYVWVGINLTAGNSSTNFQGSLNIEGTLNGNYDSRIVAPLPITPPSISSLSAPSGPVGTSITVNGAHFGSTQGTSTLKFNGVTATPTSWSAASIVAPVPSGATTGPVVVTVTGVPSNSVNFTVTPKINTLSPTSGPVGTSMTISGTTFGATQGTSTVTFNGTTATPTSWSATSIAVPVPANATTGPVVVTVSGQTSNGVTFTVTPKINSLSPTSGAVATSVTISGSTFGATQGTSTVTFNGTTATPTTWSATSIAAPVPASATTGSVVVTVNGQASNGVNFTVTPKINSLSPTSGAVGTSVTISGTTFGATQGTSTVTFNGTTATPTSWSATSIAVPVPANATTGAVVVTVSGQASNGVTFTVTPKINSLSPTSGAVGTSITISGSTFGATQGTSTVTFNGTTATPTSWSATSIAVPAPSGATTGPVVVTVSGQASNGVTFTVTPKIDSLSPGSGGIGDSVTINGTAFGATQGTSAVTFNGTTATPTSWSATTIAVPVPAGTTTGSVVVTVDGQASNGVTFTVTPKINSLSPTSGAVGTSVTISGTTFGATQGTSTITFNGITATPTSWSATSIAVPVPTGATTGPVVVTVNGQASNGVTFTLAPRIDGLSPASGGIGTPVTISGAAFGATQGTSTITFNGTTATPTSWNDTIIVAPVPSGAAAGPVVVTVGGSPSNGLTFTLITTGTVSGKITAADGTTPIPGATVKALQGATVLGTATTNSSGDYTITPIDAGTYSITASATGYGTKSRGVVTVTGGGTSTVNLSLDAIVSGPVSYIYDAVGRLISTVGPTDTVIYSYDAVGNLLSISRQSSSQVSIIQLSPNSGPIGATVTISGTGFSATASQNTVTFNGVAATITSATPTQLVTSVPSGATTGPVGVTSPNGSANSNTSFTVTDGSGGPPTISGFTPNVGAAGDSVTITGTNFELTPTDNKLKFSGSSAAVSSSTATSIVGAVPPTGAGHISVTTPAGTATSTADFYVAPPGRPASDVEFTSRSSLGGLTNVTINTPGKIGLVLFDAVAGQRVTLSFTNITMGRVRVSLINPNGTVLTGPIYEYSYPGWAVIDPISLPATGTYTVVLDGYDPITYSYSGSLTMQLYNTPPDVTGTITPGGPSIPVSITTPGQLARLTFTGAAGQAISLNIAGSLPASWVTIYKPDGSNLTGTQNLGGANWGFIDRQVLPASGTYTLVIDPQGTNTGNFDVILYDLVDVSGTLTADAPGVTTNITVPGQNASFTFDGTTSQQVSLAVTGVSMTPATNTNVFIYKPDGSLFASDTVYSWMNQIVFDGLTLPTSGTYRVFIDPPGPSTGNFTLALYNAPDVTDTITLGETKTITVPVVGQKARVTFNGTAGQTIGLNMTNPTMSAQVSVWKPDGSGLIGPTWTPGFIQMANLPATGAYTFLVDPQGSATGNLTLTLYDNSDITGSLEVNGSGITITNNPGQNALLTFEGTAGQQITVRFSNNTVGGIYGRLLKPDGSLLNDVFSGASSFTFGAASLPTTGTYKISIDQWDLNAGSVTITVTNP